MIRPAVSADEPAIRRCAEAAYAQYVAAMGRRPAPMDADYAASIAAGETHVAEDPEGVFLGFIVFRMAGGAMLLENVAIAPEAAGMGVGRVLIALCEETARASGARAVRLYTNAKMVANLGLYPRLGYVETGRKVENGFDRVYFEKPL